MKLLATTSHSLLLLDCFSGRARILHRGAGLYYGIARIGSSFAVAARGRTVSDAMAASEERGSILRFDAHFQPMARLESPFPLRDMHQIAWFDERLWVTCSFDDMVAVYDGNTWDRWYPLDLPRRSDDADIGSLPRDHYHYNSCCVSGNQIVLLAHNHGPSDLHFFDRRSRERHRSVRLGSNAHSIWRDSEAYVTCSSIEGKLVSTDGWELSTGGFPRGVCFADEYRAVGISALRERGQRDWASAAIAIYDATWELVHYVHLLHEGMVLDLAALAEDEAAAVEDVGAEPAHFPILPRLTDEHLNAA